MVFGVEEHEARACIADLGAGDQHSDVVGIGVLSSQFEAVAHRLEADRVATVAAINTLLFCVIHLIWHLCSPCGDDQVQPDAAADATTGTALRLESLRRITEKGRLDSTPQRKVQVEIHFWAAGRSLAAEEAFPVPPDRGNTLVSQATRRGSARHHRACRRKRRALPMTETELSVIAALAMMGLRSSPNLGYKTPAAIGTPRTL
jgi:hypothetical protein